MKKPLTRRAALQTTAAAIMTSSAIVNRLEAAEKAVDASLKGRVNHSVCRWCYGKIPLDDLCKASKEMGIQSVELLTLADFPTLKKYDLHCAMVSGVPGGIEKGLNRVEHHEKIAKYMEDAIPKVAEAGFKNIICFSGNRGGMNDEEGLENCAKGIQQFISVAEKHNINVCMELLNSRVNHKDYMCDRSPWGVALCKKVGSERFKLLYDIYHMQIMEGDLIATIKRDHPYFAHYHTGGVPGRAEIDETQEINYPAVMKAIVDSGFKGFVAQEFIPRRPDALASLKQGVQICDV